MGLPHILVSDYATAFTSEDFNYFLKSNGIKHVRTLPYHLASDLDGLVEQVVQTFRE